MYCGPNRLVIKKSLVLIISIYKIWQIKNTVPIPITAFTCGLSTCLSYGIQSFMLVANSQIAAITTGRLDRNIYENDSQNSASSVLSKRKMSTNTSCKTLTHNVKKLTTDDFCSA